MQDAPLSVSGHSLLRCRRINRVRYRDEDGFMHVGGIYRLEIQET
jgi:hypothetical protein